MMSLAETASAFTHEVALLDAKTQAEGSTDTGEVWELLRKYRTAFLATNPHTLDRVTVETWLNDSSGTLVGVTWEWQPKARLTPESAPGAYRIEVGEDWDLLCREDLLNLILGRR